MSEILQAFIENERAIRRIFARYCSRAEDVEDLTQETFLKCFAAEMTTDIREPKAFLLRAAKNLALSELKRKANKTTSFIEDSGGPDVLGNDGQVSVEADIDGRRKLVALAKAIASLPAPHRRALLMRKMENLKIRQIAKRLNVSVSTVEKRVAAALVMCASYLRAEGYDLAEFGAAAFAPVQRKPGDAASVIAMTPQTGARSPDGSKRHE
ncbi:MAG: sigma-70 family RNA polymerase sigma factor [Alphaproteobacteria bacterium]|nr:sigma-70 family RNA polymerase sigma factor [Alphaproteobacteria bacterium]